jgi:hypothetical protein
MKIPPPDLVYISQEVDRLGRDLADAWHDAGSPGDSPSPGQTLRAAHDLFDALHGHADTVPTPEATKELRALGEHGLHLLQTLAEQAQALGLAGPASALRHLSFPLALWLARRGAEFGTLEPVADAVAELANRLNTPRDLAELYPLLEELVEATAAGGDSGGRPPRRAWRVLVLNRAIVATRSHRPPLMEEAFNAVAELLPDDAAAFFQEAMEQMDIVGYPAHVREVVERHYRRHCTNRVLH